MLFYAAYLFIMFYYVFSTMIFISIIFISNKAKQGIDNFVKYYRDQKRTRTIKCIFDSIVLLSDESWSWGNRDFNFLARILSTRDLHKTLRCITNNLCCQIFSLLRWITKLLKIQLNRLFTSIIKWKGQNDKNEETNSWKKKMPRSSSSSSSSFVLCLLD